VALTLLSSIPGAAVPIITFDYDGINIDLLFASLPLDAVPEDFDVNFDDVCTHMHRMHTACTPRAHHVHIACTCTACTPRAHGVHGGLTAVQVLRGVDQGTEKSLNGPRVTEMLTRLVPNYDAFLAVVRCVRLWAKRRGLYSNKMGFFGGINCNLLVCFVCQLYPQAAAARLLERFFFILKDWAFPTPIMLTPPYDAGLGLEVWDPQVGNAVHHFVHYTVHHFVHYTVRYFVHYTVRCIVHSFVHYTEHCIVHCIVHYMVHCTGRSAATASTRCPSSRPPTRR